MKKLKALRLANNLSQQKLSEKIQVSRSTIAMWESGASQPDNYSLVKLADFFGVSTDYLLGKSENKKDISLNLSEMSNIITFDKFKSIPIIGTIACGEPILAEENHEGYTNVEIDVHADFALRCKGDSMSPKFSDGDIVLIRQQPDVENGQIAAVLIDNEATLKRVYKNHDSVLLSPENLSYQPMVYTGEDLNNIRILGLAVGYTRIF